MGRASEMAAMAPIPGNTPTNMPTTTARKHSMNRSGESAAWMPAIMRLSVSKSEPPGDDDQAETPDEDGNACDRKTRRNQDGSDWPYAGLAERRQQHERQRRRDEPERPDHFRKGQHTG